MPPARKTTKRRKQRSKTLKDYFAVERSIKKRDVSNQKGDQLFKLEQCTASCVGNGVCNELSPDVEHRDTKNVVESKSQKNQRWNTLKDFYPVRRSNRKPESEIKREKLQEIEETVLSEEERGLRVCSFDGKGRGVVAAKPFVRSDFVVEYRGDLIDTNEAKSREAVYERDPTVGCYMYYFQHKNQAYCVDATAESGYLGRLVNHSAKDPNCVTRVIEVKEKPHLILVAARDILVGEELLYDYGDRSRDSVEANPWLRNT